MSLLIQYLIKLSVGLALVWLFYQFVLRRLTFYNSNRWYLLAYTILVFYIPFINISVLMNNSAAGESGLIRFFPSVHQYTVQLEEASHYPVPIWSTSYDKWDWTAFAVMTGAGLLLIRFMIRFISFLRMQRKARLISADGVKLYQVNENIIPFSFGGAVFINSRLHTAAELQEIIHHEFIHVKQRHTVDIIWAELLCILNWYNPFAWLLKRSIRQNLEFIADNKVLENGINKKEYQYLLLKVIGNNQYSIATPFNFSSLKKRIAMMNKLKTARVHLLRFLFILPLLVVILLSFRQQQSGPVISPGNGTEIFFYDGKDTLPAGPTKKGYWISIVDNKGNCTIVVKDKKGKEVDRLLLTKWNENEKYYVGLYGELPPPPPPVPADAPSPLDAPVPPVPPTPPAAPAPADLPDHVKNININNNKATVTLKDGKVENYDLNNATEKKEFEKKYGQQPEVPIPPAPAKTPGGRIAISKMNGVDNLEILCDEFEITDKKATMHLKSGVTEEYDLTNMEERRKFEKKFGRIINLGKGENAVAPVAILNGQGDQTIIAPMNPAAMGRNEFLALDQEGGILNGKEDILITITKNTTRRELESFKQQMKAKGVELTFDEVEYDEKGILVSISGRMKSKDGQSNFSAFDFSRLVLAMVKNGDHSYFKVRTTDSKVVI